MNVSETIKHKTGRKSVIVAIIVIVLLFAFSLLNSDDGEVEATETKQTVVTTTTASEYNDGQSLSLIGNVRALSEAKITSERAGRIVSVNVDLGQQVGAGAVLATLENASERAAVLQAEGFYDAAVAASAQSGIGVGEATTNLSRTKNSTLSTIKSAYNTINNAVISDIDVYYRQPQSPAPRLNIAGEGFRRQLEIERDQLSQKLNDWSNYINTLNPDSDLQVALNLSEENVEFVLDMVDTFLIIFKEDENIARTNSFTLLRTSIINTKSALENAGSSLESAKDTVKRAELSASGNIVSASDAQIKQALGSLRAAQANFAKTILKTPISGTINSLSVRPGDFINSFTQVGVVANNSALEIVTFVSDDELPLIKEGETVTVENEFVGTVTQIAPAVDINTRKTEVRITLSDTDIANGDTVKITKDLSINESTDIKVQVPLTAIKFAREDGSVFFVEDGVAKSRSVTLGNILGNSVEVTGGLNQNEEFIVDVRGLVEGENVQIDN